MCEHGNQVAVKAPNWSGKESISIDSCIVDQIQALWDAGVVTQGCCCGHNQRECSVIIEHHFEPFDISIAYDILNRDIERRWHLEQWTLVTIAQKPIGNRSII